MVKIEYATYNQNIAKDQLDVGSVDIKLENTEELKVELEKDIKLEDLCIKEEIYDPPVEEHNSENAFQTSTQSTFDGNLLEEQKIVNDNNVIVNNFSNNDPNTVSSAIEEIVPENKLYKVIRWVNVDSQHEESISKDSAWNPYVSLVKLELYQCKMCSNVSDCEICDKCSSESYTDYCQYNSIEREHSALCEYCVNKNKKKLVLINHILTIKSDKSQVSKQDSKLKQLKTYMCTFCNHRCTNRSNMTRHVKHKHTKEKQHRCNVCEYQTVKKGDLQRHMRTHTGEKPFSCPYCDYRCVESGTVKRHMRYKHTNEKNYECKICHNKYVQKCDLVKHILSHRGEKMLACQLCNYKFTRTGDLIRHLKQKHNTE